MQGWAQSRAEYAAMGARTLTALAVSSDGRVRSRVRQDRVKLPRKRARCRARRRAGSAVANYSAL